MTIPAPAVAEGFRLIGDRDEAAVLIHGFTGIPAHFRPLGEFLQGHGYTVSVPRLPGHGTTMEDMATTSSRDWLRAVNEAIASVSSNRRIHLVGLSMGGLLAIIAAGRFPVTTVTTINSPVIVRNPRFYLTPLVHRVRPMVEWPPEDPPDLDDEVAAYWMPYPGFPTRAAADLLSLSWQAVRVAGRLRRPALVIQSPADETVHPVSARILAHRLGSRCELTWLRSSVHNALLDRERFTVHSSVLSRIRTC